jgi:Na+/phosphate symporter
MEVYMTDTEKIDQILLKMESFATKDDLKAFATKDDLKAFATKDDLKDFATKDDLKAFATKADLRHETNLVLEELDKTEQRLNRRIDSTNKDLQELRQYVTAVRYNNEIVEILMKRQDNVEQRLQKVERKVLCS